MSRLRSIERRRKPALGLGLAAALALAASATPGAAPPRSGGASVAAPEGFRRVGMNSCGARGCHGAVGPTDPERGEVYIEGGAFTTWRGFDPHAGAFAALLTERSRSIVARLEKPLAGAQAHEARLCLACHASAESTSPAPELARGVDCEGCHGPAARWETEHFTLAWKGKTPEAKARLGLHDLSRAALRAESCVGCHVGDRSRGMDVNHDLIAAGHPRLAFEYASYLAALPRHWREPHEKARTAGSGTAVLTDFEAKSWAVGQVVTARAALDLLADRATAALAGRPGSRDVPSSPWPEFAESECFACHHVPAGPDRDIDRNPFALATGRLPWSSWPLALLPTLAGGRDEVNPAAVASPWATLRAEMSRVEPDEKLVADLARSLARRLDGWAATLEAAPIDAERVQTWLDEVAKKGPARVATWDGLAQRTLAVVALRQALADLGSTSEPSPAVAEWLRRGLDGLAFPPGYDSPRPARERHP